MSAKDLDHAVSLLNANDVVGIPTETVYGLAGSIYSEVALKKIFSTKERPFFDPLIVHVASIEQGQSLALRWSKAQEVLADAFWPGPLTLVVEKNTLVSDLITSGLTTVGLRMPRHDLALNLIKQFGKPLAAPSANKFGKTSPTSAEHVREEFKSENIFVLDGGPCDVGVESTVLYVDQLGHDSEVSLAILRAGHIVLSDIIKVLEKNRLKVKNGELSVPVAAPGQMKHHYMPKKPLIFLDEGSKIESSIPEVVKLLKLIPAVVESVNVIKPSKIESWRELTLSDKPEEAARQLYSQLRIVSEGSEDIIYFQRKSHHQGEHWEAILDRLGKAATVKI